MTSLWRVTLIPKSSSQRPAQVTREGLWDGRQTITALSAKEEANIVRLHADLHAMIMAPSRLYRTHGQAARTLKSTGSVSVFASGLPKSLSKHATGQRTQRGNLARPSVHRQCLQQPQISCWRQ
ncbi:hypothetical protein NL108_011917 [Boleophthalmus pectinirostris]|nr:hypothetical protein NL108_011917 [Boleophthalmus pectinirostris]